MKLPKALEAYTNETMNARQAQRLAEFIAFGPIVFQVARVMLKFGMLDVLRDADEPLTIEQVAEATHVSVYGARVLLEAALSAQIVLTDEDNTHYRLSKTGWFLINDPATRVNIDVNHFINYRGFYQLEEAIRNGKPEGLKTLGEWETIYQGLSQLKEDERRSWFNFDHFYSDAAFNEALPIVFDRPVKRLMDVGGNTGKWALRCTSHDPDVNVTIVDLPQQIALMNDNVKSKPGAERISGFGTNLLKEDAALPDDDFDVIWMSQFLDCFSPDEITSILRLARTRMTAQTRLLIMETFWDRQRFEPASFCLTQISLYFTVMANGNSKMYGYNEMTKCIADAGLKVADIHDNLGQGHSIITCTIK